MARVLVRVRSSAIRPKPERIVYDALDVDSAKVLKSAKEKAEELEAMANSPARKIEEQIMALNLETAQLKNDLARAQIAKTEAETQSIQDGDTLDVSVSLMRSGATSELRLALVRDQGKGWLVSEVRG